MKLHQIHQVIYWCFSGFRNRFNILFKQLIIKQQVWLGDDDVTALLLLKKNENTQLFQINRKKIYFNEKGFNTKIVTQKKYLQIVQNAGNVIYASLQNRKDNVISDMIYPMQYLIVISIELLLIILKYGKYIQFKQSRLKIKKATFSQFKQQQKKINVCYSNQKQFTLFKFFVKGQNNKTRNLKLRINFFISFVIIQKKKKDNFLQKQQKLLIL
eukprot:TRINITY_DN5931_c0_g1_i2.p1 TRINITY_DN5931_c0_g1~~TRINITY_DN5931_c0_g1_i2.p1  ORF type:complete len:231 (-),score=0.74 TRINITY_DN5931_c0_g1_i2:141-782(-)